MKPSCAGPGLLSPSCLCSQVSFPRADTFSREWDPLVQVDLETVVFSCFYFLPYTVASKIFDSIHFEFEREELVYFRNGKQEGLVRRGLGFVPDPLVSWEPLPGACF